MSASIRKRRACSEETKKKIRAGNIGKKRTVEQNKNNSEARIKYYKTHTSQLKGTHETPEHTEKRRKALVEFYKTHTHPSKGIKRSEEINEKNRKGHLKFYKTPEGEECKKKISKSHKGKHNTKEHNRKISESNKNHKVSELTRQRISHANTGKKHTAERVLKNKKSHIGIPNTEEQKKKQSEALLLFWKDDKNKQTRLKAIFKGIKTTPNKSEKLLGKLVQRLLPKEYKFVGDGQVIIGGFCPDFINVNGQKKIIELYGDYWHANHKKYKANDIVYHNIKAKDIWKKDKRRINTFKKYGYQTSIIWEHELKDNSKLIKKLIEYNKVGGK